MPIVDEVQKALTQFPKVAADRDELTRLQRFLEEAKKAGIATVRTYDLPLPDTIGRGMAEVRSKTP